MKLLRQRSDEELDSEIRNHLDEAIRDRIARGETPEDARVNAFREFGNVGLVKEVTRAMWGWAWLERLLQDVRFGLRMWRKHWGFSLVAIFTLAFGIGANLTIFSFVDTFFLRPIPAREPKQLINVEAWWHDQWEGYFSYPAYLYYRDHAKSFGVLAAHYSTAALHLGGEGDARMVDGAVVSANYFPMLGINPRLGRFFLPEDDAVPDRDPVVVISERMW